MHFRREQYPRLESFQRIESDCLETRATAVSPSPNGVIPMADGQAVLPMNELTRNATHSEALAWVARMRRLLHR
jgi:hypothetical protein